MEDSNPELDELRAAYKELEKDLEEAINYNEVNKVNQSVVFLLGVVVGLLLSVTILVLPWLCELVKVHFLPLTWW